MAPTMQGTPNQSTADAETPIKTGNFATKCFVLSQHWAAMVLN